MFSIFNLDTGADYLPKWFTHLLKYNFRIRVSHTYYFIERHLILYCWTLMIGLLQTLSSFTLLWHSINVVDIALNLLQRHKRELARDTDKNELYVLAGNQLVFAATRQPFYWRLLTSKLSTGRCIIFWEPDQDYACIFFLFLKKVYI